MMPWKPMMAALVLAIIGNAVIVGWFATGDLSVPPIGNVTAIGVCSAALWIVDARRRRGL